VIAFIPTAPQLVEKIKPEVYQGLLNQGLTPIPFVVDDYSSDRRLRLPKIAKTRNKIAKFAQCFQGKYFAMCDYDVLLQRDSVDEMIKRHEVDSKLGAIMLTSHDELSYSPASSSDRHIGMYFGIWKKEALRDFDCTITGRGCECIYAKKSLEDAGWKVELLEPISIGRFKHLKY